jgi:hypothetical protein
MTPCVHRYSAGLGSDLRVNVTDLVTLATDALRYHGETASSTGSAGEHDHPLHCSDPAAALPRAFGIGLGLLSMQLDLVDGLLEQARKALTGSAEEAQEHLLTMDVLEQRLTAAERQREALHRLLVGLWAALVAANTAAWLEIACYPSLGAQEESALKNDFWLFSATVDALSEASAGVLREEVVITNDAGEEDLLEQALTASGVSSMRLESDGEARRLPPGEVNKRVLHVIKVCVDMALREGSVVQQ